MNVDSCSFHTFPISTSSRLYVFNRRSLEIIFFLSKYVTEILFLIVCCSIKATCISTSVHSLLKMLSSSSILLLVCCVAFNIGDAYGKKNWDFECEFKVGTGRSKYLGRITNEDTGKNCGQFCLDSPSCTHFNYDGENCMLLSGSVTLADKSPKEDPDGEGIVCGVVRPNFG